MLNIEIFRNRIAAQGGDTVLNERNATLDVFCGESALRYKVCNWYCGQYNSIDEFQIPEDLNK